VIIKRDPRVTQCEFKGACLLHRSNSREQPVEINGKLRLLIQEYYCIGCSKEGHSLL
jgi:hypothetical protein